MHSTWAAFEDGSEASASSYREHVIPTTTSLDIVTFLNPIQNAGNGL